LDCSGFFNGRYQHAEILQSGKLKVLNKSVFKACQDCTNKSGFSIDLRAWFYVVKVIISEHSQGWILSSLKIDFAPIDLASGDCYKITMVLSIKNKG